MSELHYRRAVGIVIDPYDLISGQIIEFRNKQYYFRPNGCVAYLYSTLEDYKKRRNRYCIARSILKGCQLLVDIDVFNMDTEESINEVNIVSKETFDEILKSRRSLFTTEEVQAILDRTDS